MRKVIADLKAHLSKHLRAVRTGRTLMVLDRDAPVARVVPIDAGPFEIRKATRRPRDLRPVPPAAAPINSLGTLLADRERR